MLDYCSKTPFSLACCTGSAAFPVSGQYLRRVWACLGPTSTSGRPTTPDQTRDGRTSRGLLGLSCVSPAALSIVKFKSRLSVCQSCSKSQRKPPDKNNQSINQSINQSQNWLESLLQRPVQSSPNAIIHLPSTPCLRRIQETASNKGCTQISPRIIAEDGAVPPLLPLPSYD